MTFTTPHLPAFVLRAAFGTAMLCAGVTAAAAETPQDILHTMERAADWELAHPANASRPTFPGTDQPLGWAVGAFYTGLTALADRSADPRYAEVVVALGEREGWALGPRPFHADDYEVAQQWIWAYGRKHDPRMIAAVRQRFDAVIAAHLTDSLLMVPRGGCQRRWCWSDALFMGPPGWVALAQATGDPRYQAYADKEYGATTSLLFDPDQALFYRDSTFFGKKGEHGEKIFWSRGNGWVYAGLARILTMLPEDSPSRPRYQALFLKMSRRIVALQKPDGSWAPSLLDPRAGTPPETSGTGFFSYGLAWGVHAALLKGLAIDARRSAAGRCWPRQWGRTASWDGCKAWAASPTLWARTIPSPLAWARSCWRDRR